MYDVTLINLTADARSAAVDANRVDFRALPAERLRELLQNFAALDAIENASADPEVRVQTHGRSFLVHSARGKLILQDVLNRDVATQSMTAEEAMSEIDGSAAVARAMRAQTAVPWVVPAEEIVTSPAPRQRARRIALVAVATLLLAALVALRLDRGEGRAFPGFTPLAENEAAAIRATLAGVYLTGTEPGDHGISIFDTGEVRLFQFRAGDTPGLVYADAKLGRRGEAVCIATDQPGGLITVPNQTSLVYCGETYNRVP